MKRHLPIAILLGCGVLFAFGVVVLFQLRFESGDVYPPYSSLRADPLGTMALYESLEKLQGVSVKRDFSDASRLPEEPHTVYLHLAASRYEWDRVPKDLLHEIQNFLARGNRLVIGFSPETKIYAHRNGEAAGETNSVKSANPAGGKTPPPKQIKKTTKTVEDDSYSSIEDEWGFHLSFEPLRQDEGNYQPVTVWNRSDLPLPRTLDWHSGTILTNCDTAWQTIYARGNNPVVVERNFGKGSVVFATDSYFVSNEALAGEHSAAFLTWLIGENRNIVFDESHFGIVETSGVALLMRKYRLHGLAAGLLLLAILFIWKNATSLVPPHASEKNAGFVAGKDAASGFTNLLRRNIAPGDLLATCFSEWKNSLARTGTVSTARVQKAEAIFQADHSLPNKDRNPIETYKNISEALGIRNKKL